MSVTVIQFCKYCDVCDNWAQYFCKDCQLILCEQCVLKHLNFYRCHGHDVVRYRDKTTNNSSIPMCSLHSLKAEFFCKTCDVYACQKSFVLHKFHQIVDFREKIDRLFANGVLLRGKVIPMIDNLLKKENDFLMRNCMVFEKMRSELEKRLTTCPTLIVKCKRNGDSTTVKGIGGKDLMALMLKKAIEDWKIFHIQKIRLENCRRFVCDTLEELKENLCNPISLRDLHSPFLHDLQSALELKVIFPQIPVFQIEHSKDTDNEVMLTYSRKRHQSVYVKAVFEDNKFVMLSIYLHRKRLSSITCAENTFAWICGPDHPTVYKIDLQGTVLKKIPLNLHAIYMCASVNEIFYSDYTDNTIKVLSVSDDLVYKDRIICTNDQNWCPMSLTISRTPPKDKVILVCEYNAFIDHGRVCKYNTNNDEILLLIEYTDCFSTIPLYSSVWSVTENINGDIWVVDGKKYSVIVVNECGCFLNVYEGQQNDFVFIPWGITHNSFGQILISDHYNFRVHILDLRGNFIKFLYLHYTDLPTGISCGPDNKLWIVGDNGKVNIFVYK